MKKFFIIFLIFTLFFLSFCSAFYVYFKNYPVNSTTKIVDIPKSSSAKTISNLLEYEKIIPSHTMFYLLTKLTGNDKNLKSGEYKFEKNLTYFEVLDILVRGKIFLYKVVIPEGLNIYEIAKVLKKSDIIPKEKEFTNFCTDKNKIKNFLNNGFSMEGYLFPDTYNFYKNEKIYKIVKTMNDNFIKKVLPVIRESGKYLTVNEVVILSSIIQKETYNKKEMPVIASVFFNRMKRGMKLQSDPTIIYGLWKKFRGYLTKKDLKFYTVYNTYLNYGLPPTPISNPGIAAIKAVLYPAKTDLLYFVSTGKGYHAFARTYKEHRRNIRLYRRKSR